jgi:hypothetical protein
VGEVLAVEGTEHVFFGGWVVLQRTFGVVLGPAQVQDLECVCPNFAFCVLGDDPASLQIVVLL